VESLDSTNDLSRVQFSTYFIEPLLFPQVCEELTAIQKINEEVQLAIGLERIMQAHDVRVLDLLEDVSLGLSLNQ